MVCIWVFGNGVCSKHSSAFGWGVMWWDAWNARWPWLRWRVRVRRAGMTHRELRFPAPSGPSLLLPRWRAGVGIWLASNLKINRKIQTQYNSRNVYEYVTNIWVKGHRIEWRKKRPNQGTNHWMQSKIFVSVVNQSKKAARSKLLQTLFWHKYLKIAKSKLLQKYFDRNIPPKSNKCSQQYCAYNEKPWN